MNRLVGWGTEALNQPVYMAALSVPLDHMAGIRSPHADSDWPSLNGALFAISAFICGEWERARAAVL